MKDRPSAPRHLGDVNEELAKFLSNDSDEYQDYVSALLFGGPFECREERLICAADQLLLCTFSSGLFSYFELQSEHSALGIEAFVELGLPDFARIVERVLELLSLGKAASPSDIKNASALIVDCGFEQFIDEMEPIESFIDENNGLITMALSEYIRRNSKKLRRELR